jgi:hypothetical protein
MPTRRPGCDTVSRVPFAVPPPLVTVQPTREVRTVAPVNEIAIDSGRAATLVGTVHGWEYMLVWSPQGVVVRASLNCDTQESNIVLTTNQIAHLCYQGTNYVVTGTIQPLRERVSLHAAGSAVISLAGEDTLLAGSVGLVGRSVSTVIWRFDARTKTKLRSYPSRAVLVAVDRGRLLIDRPKALDVLTRDGALVTTLRRAHEGGAAMRGGRVATITGKRLVVSGVDGKSLVVGTVAARAHLEDLDGGLVLYSVETRLHLLRLADGKDVALRLRSQFGYAHARLWHGSLFYGYNQRSGRLGHAGFVDAGHVRTLLASR